MRVGVNKVIPQEHISALERICQNTKDKDLLLHTQALLLRSQGKTLKQIRDTLGVPESTVKFYTKRLKQKGVNGLMYQGQAGNRKLLTKEQESKLKAVLSTMEAWYPSMVRDYILAYFGVRYADSSHSIIKLMEQMGFVRDIRTGEVFITPAVQKQLAPVRDYYLHPTPQELYLDKWTEKRFGYKFSYCMIPPVRGHPKKHM